MARSFTIQNCERRSQNPENCENCLGFCERTRHSPPFQASLANKASQNFATNYPRPVASQGSLTLN